MNLKQKAEEIIRRLRKEYPGARTALHYHSPFELLAATILSAQTTDAHVNKVTESLFKKYRTIADYAHAPAEVFRKDVSSVNFYNTKAKNIQGAANMIIRKYNGVLPKTMNELTALPGVARKTANIILFNIFSISEGIAVDTHVARLSQRLGLTHEKDPVKIEKELMKIISAADWGNTTNLLISHGRKICQAKKPNHADCILSDICPSRNK